MNPEPFASNSSAQPFTDSTAQPTPGAPLPLPTGAVSNISAGDYVPPISPQGTSTAAAVAASPEFAPLIKAHSRGANWFFWIVALSLVNAVLISGGSDRVLAIGTNATLIMDYAMKEAIAKSANMAGAFRGMEVIFDILVLGFYGFCGWMAVRGKPWAFYLGMTVFALDTLISVIDVDVIGGLIHAWALFTMWQGAQALKQMIALRKAAEAPASPWAV